MHGIPPLLVRGSLSHRAQARVGCKVSSLVSVMLGFEQSVYAGLIW